MSCHVMVIGSPNAGCAVNERREPERARTLRISRELLSGLIRFTPNPQLSGKDKSLTSHWILRVLRVVRENMTP
jgi:hypothetical protein